jgi:glycosyltransferase involved in cell wall biosynthesis
MRVLHVIPSLSWVHGGPSQAIRTMERALRGQGVEVLVATTDDDGRGKRIERVPAVPLSEESGRRVYFRKRIEFYCVAPAITVWLWRNVRNFDCVHIHALFSFTSSVAALIARARGVPYIVRPLGVLNQYAINDHKFGLRQLSLLFLERPILRRAALVHCTSAQEADDVRAVELKSNCTVQALAIDLPVLSADASQEVARPVVLYLSRLDPKKNLESLLNAWPSVVERVPTALLKIAGSGDPTYVEKLRTQVETLGIQASVEWVGHVSGDAKSACFRGAHVFVLPSFAENFGIAVAEALSYGLPSVVARGVALSDEISSHGAGLRIEPTAEAISSALIQALSDQHWREGASRAARQLAESSFSVAALGEGLVKMYRSIIPSAEKA